MEYEITPKLSGGISYSNNILNGLNNAGRSYQSNYAAKVITYIKANFNIRQLSPKGDTSVQYYLYNDIFSINNRKVLTYYPVSNTIYFGFAVPNAGEISLNFNGNTLYVNQVGITGSMISKMSIPALSGIKRNGIYLLDPLPNGDYTVNNGHHRGKDEQRGGFYRDGVGFTFDITPLFASLNGKKMERSLLRIHPDGNSPGSAGCIALGVDRPVLTAFYDAMKEYMAKKGAVRLKVEDPNNPNIMYNRHKGVKSHE
ncbi:hypothetical protein [Mucilaginibacter polytrichastri]|uniref:Uncharacterized protein n=1 Tax=Mucilaginibacter polytrichastri TaxID=1302689 RepID=A0A1Q6A2F6_9SPHI|nr:hypothetical protein [Mucilaginibacter polytrichastri]OKS88204.1 hypothetical protein RG47T_3668 [Mucilaginibacter polytrichastri]SFT08407.1 hypothetical protein SAMN04487890_11029 [Mucilaginibacter polytrichastri]